MYLEFLSAGTILLIAIGLVPIAIILAFFLLKKRQGNQPFILFALAFFLGIGAMALVYYLPLPVWVRTRELLTVLYDAFIRSAIPEELIKFLLLLAIIHFARGHLQRPITLVFCTVFIAMGFAAIENVIYVLRFGYLVGLQRAFISVPGHFLFALIMGYYAAMSQISRRQYLTWALVLPILVHGLFNTLLSMIAIFASWSVLLRFIAVFLFFCFDISLWILALIRLNVIESLAKQKPVHKERV